MAVSIDTDDIKNWRSILTFVVFFLSNFAVLWHYNIKVYLPRLICDHALRSLRVCRIIRSTPDVSGPSSDSTNKTQPNDPICLNVPIKYTTAPLMAVLFLLATTAIGRHEVYSGILGGDSMGITPYDVVLVFLCLGYIGNSLQASGLVRYLVFGLIERTGGFGHRLFFYLYVCFFVLGIFIGNDPIMLMAVFYLTQFSESIKKPTGWMHTQFAIANIATGLLVSSNPTNLVLAGTFNIKFVHFTANMVVPTMVTAVVLLPSLLFLVFADEDQIPKVIRLPDLLQPTSTEGTERRPVLSETLKPFLDRKSAFVGSVIMTLTVISLLTLNAIYLQSGGNTDYWVTLPAASAMLLWDLRSGWKDRHVNRRIMYESRLRAKARKEVHSMFSIVASQTATQPHQHVHHDAAGDAPAANDGGTATVIRAVRSACKNGTQPLDQGQINGDATLSQSVQAEEVVLFPSDNEPAPEIGIRRARALTNRRLSDPEPRLLSSPQTEGPVTVQSLLEAFGAWCRVTFPTVTVVLQQLPYALVPFAFPMFILVEGLASTGWTPVMAYGWDNWVQKTGAVGAIGGMGFLSLILSNIAGTNIGACIFFTRVIQAWQELHHQAGTSITEREFWGTIYSLSLGVNLGAFSLTFSASMGGIMWQTVLNQHRIERIGRLDFARANLPIIAIVMMVSCTVLVGQTYTVRGNAPFDV